VPKLANPLHVVQNVLHHAQSSEDAKHKRVESAGLSPQMVQLREFQVRRIANTYRDFAAQPQYAPAMKFFLEDLYAARDFTQRDHDAERAHTFLRKIVPADMLQLATEAIELTGLSNALDETMCRILVSELNWRGELTPALYGEAYRRSNNYAERQRQIELLESVMHDAAETAHMLLTGPAMRMAKAPAYAAGWHEMYDFLERGHQAFAKVKQPDALLDAIEERETKIMRRIAAGEPNPFR
jgi:hypothetical protein